MNANAPTAPPSRSSSSSTSPTASSGTLQYMSFRLGDQAYGIDILSVQEIRRYSPPTPLPDVPAHVMGLVNLRGAVVPVFDLRVRFGLSDKSVGRLTVIIVVVVREHSVGLVVDEVTRVLRLPAGGLRPTPAFNQHIDTSFIVGLAPQDEGMVTILDVERLVSADLGNIK
jgi:purine-binding chemotaxis protein CheW